MSTALDPQPQQQPPPVAIYEQEAYSSTHSGHGSVGPVIAVLAVIAILGVVAGMIGRLCTGRRIMGHAQYDVEGWVERKCASCIDGRIDDPPVPPPNVINTNNNNNNNNPSADSVQIETPQETKHQPQQSPQNPSAAAGS